MEKKILSLFCVILLLCGSLSSLYKGGNKFYKKLFAQPEENEGLDPEIFQLPEGEKAKNVDPTTLSERLKNESILEAVIGEIEEISGISTDTDLYKWIYTGSKYILKYSGLDTLQACQGENLIEISGDYIAATIEDGDITENIKSLAEFGAKMEQDGRNFLFFRVPFKLSGDAENDARYEEYKDFLTNYESEQTQEVVEMMESYGLEMYSVSDEMTREGYGYQDIFFKTDHHWTPQSGLWAAGLLAGELNTRFGYSIDTSNFNRNNYDIEIKEKCFLGYYGNKLTTAYVQPEDFAIITPKFDTSYTVYNSFLGETVEALRGGNAEL